MTKEQIDKLANYVTKCNNYFRTLDVFTSVPFFLYDSADRSNYYQIYVARGKLKDEYANNYDSPENSKLFWEHLRIPLFRTIDSPRYTGLTDMDIHFTIYEYSHIWLKNWQLVYNDARLDFIIEPTK